MMPRKKKKNKKTIETLTHEETSRKNIPTAEYQSVMYKVYIDPPYGIKINSNFQWSTTSRDVKDGNIGHITREPEQVKAFRDTWRDGIHSYLTYSRDRLTVAHDLLTDSGSVLCKSGMKMFIELGHCSMNFLVKTILFSQSLSKKNQRRLLRSQ